MLASLATFAKRKTLARQLKNADPEQRVAALNELADIKSPEDFNLFIAALRDESGTVRHAAARILGGLEDPRAVPPLLEALNDPTIPEGACHTEILFALEQLKDPRALETCATSLTSRDVKVRRAAAAALGGLGAISSVETLATALNDEDEGVVRQAADALSKVGAPAIPALTRALAEGSTYAKQASARALGTIGNPKVIPALIGALRDADTFVQVSAAKAMSCFDDPRVIAALIEALEDSSAAAFFYGVREEAEQSLMKMGARAIEPFIQTLRTPESRGRLFIVKMMESIRSPRTYEVLAEVLSDPNPDIRKAAVLALAALNPLRARPYLKPALDDASVYVRRAAGQALETGGWEPETPEDKARLAIALGKYFSMIYAGPEAVGLLLNYLHDADPVTRREVAKALGRLQSPELLEPLRVMVIGEPQEEVQQAVMEAMAECGGAAVDSFVFLLESGSWTLRRAAAQYLKTLGWQPTTAEQQVLFGLATSDAETTALGAENIPEQFQQLLEGETDPDIQGTAFLARERMQKPEPGT